MHGSLLYSCGGDSYPMGSVSSPSVPTNSDPSDAVDASKSPMHEGRFPCHHVQRKRVVCVADAYRGRNKVDRPPPVYFGFGHGDGGRDGFPNKLLESPDAMVPRREVCELPRTWFQVVAFLVDLP